MPRRDPSSSISVALALGLALVACAPAAGDDPSADTSAETAGDCARDIDCDDADPCSDDRCVAGSCEHSLALGARCDDGDACTRPDRCDEEGRCVGAARALPSDPCLDCTCDPLTGQRCRARLVGSPCDDGDCCSLEGRCQSCDPSADPGCDAWGLRCVGAPACDAPPPCAIGACRCDQGGAPVCSQRPRDDGARCEPAPELCAPPGECQAGVCVSEAPPTLDDGDPCTVDRCDPETGAVVHLHRDKPAERSLRPGPGEAEDAFIASAPPGDPEGTSRRLLCGFFNGGADEARALLRFDVAPLPASASAVTLWLFPVSLEGTPRLRLERLTSPWEETWTWGERPTTEALAKLPIVTAGQPYPIDLSALFSDWVEGGVTNEGVQLRAQPPGGAASPTEAWVRFSSGEDGNVTRRPRLVIEYDCESPPR